MIENFKEHILALKPNDATFDALALDIFNYQYKNNAFYRSYCTLIKKLPETVKKITDIPFLPIIFFKNHTIKTGEWIDETVFTSSGTTSRDAMLASNHHVCDISFYNKISRKGFENFYGKIADYCILGLLPAYLERTGSSLVAMTDDFIRQSKYPQSGFFLYDHQKLYKILRDNQEKNIPTLLIGVTFALLDFSEELSAISYQLSEKPNIQNPKSKIVIMETGGMKGRRKEMIREELHEILKKSFGVPQIHSEYGMTELLSQGYSTGNGIFAPIPSMRVLLREVTDPFSIFDFRFSIFDLDDKTKNPKSKIQNPKSKTGVINIIDLANIDTCSFIATDDLGKLYPDGTFEVLGRLDTADIRGCNLLVG